MARQQPFIPIVHPELLGLLQSVRATPEDDIPRLILADWLDEHGQADRGELIRIQCEMGRLMTDSPRWFELRGREKSLLAQHESEWLGPLAPYGRFWRGLLGLILRAGPFFSKDVTAALRGEAGVWLDSLVLYGLDAEQVNRFASRKFLSGLSVLEVSGIWNDRALLSLLRSPHLTQLRTLVLGVRGITAAGAEALAQWQPLPRLTLLDLTGNPLGNAGVAALVSSPSIASLRTLRLTATGITDPAVEALAASPHLDHVHELCLDTNAITDIGALALARSPYLKSMKRLVLHGLQFGPEAAEALLARFGEPGGTVAWGFGIGDD